MDKKKIAGQIKSARKYKIDRPEPYARVEWSHLRSGRHEVVEFPQRKTSGVFDWFLAGMCVSGAIFSLAYMAWRIL